MASLRCFKALFACATLSCISTHQASPSDVGSKATWNDEGKRICWCSANPCLWLGKLVIVGTAISSSSQSLQSLSSKISSERGGSWIVPSLSSKLGKWPWPASEKSSSHLESLCWCFMISNFWSELGWVPWAFTWAASLALDSVNFWNEQRLT